MSSETSVMASEMELVEIIKFMIDNYDHSPELVEDIEHYVRKLRDLLHLGVEEIQI